MSKSKNNEHQLVELNAKNLPKEITDPETGKKIKVSHDMVTTLISAERQITGGVEQIALALYKIREQKLYLLYELNSMEEYLEQRFQFSRALGYRLLKYAEVFGDSKHFAEIMQQPRKLLEIAAHDDQLTKELKQGEVTMPDGSKMLVKDLKKSFANELVNELELTKKQLKEQKKRAREFEQGFEERGKLIEHYEETVGGDNFQKITQKKAIISELFAIDAQVAEIVKRLAAIESEEPEVVAKLESVLGYALAGFSQVQNNWMHLIMHITPDQK